MKHRKTLKNVMMHHMEKKRIDSLLFSYAGIRNFDAVFAKALLYRVFILILFLESSNPDKISRHFP